MFLLEMFLTLNDIEVTMRMIINGLDYTQVSRHAKA